MHREKSTDTHIHKYAEAAFQVPTLDVDVERELIRRWQEHGDIKARDEVVKANLKIAVAVARQHLRYGIPYDDLIALGSLGVMKAMSKYKLDHKSKKGGHFRPFGAYAWHWIRAMIMREECKQWHMCSGQPTSSRRLFSLIKLIGKGQAIFGSDQNLVCEYVAEHLDVPVSTACEWITLVNSRVLSLDRLCFIDDSDSGKCLKDKLVDTTSEPVDSRYEEKCLQQRVRKKLRAMEWTLSRRDRKILQLRLLRTEPIARDVLAAEEGVSGERIRQLENVLRSKLRRLLREEAEILGINTEECYERIFTEDAAAA